MFKWHSKFSLSIFMICLFEFVFWSHCTYTPAGTDEEMYMKSFNNMKLAEGSQHHEDGALNGSLEEEAENAIVITLKEEQLLYSALASFITDIDTTFAGLQGTWFAVGLSLLAIVFLFPHFTKKVYEAAITGPRELFFLLKFKFAYKVPEFPTDLSPADIYSYKKLVKVSRSFAAVIAELPEELRRAVSC